MSVELVGNMLPARFKALNADSDEESKGEDDIPTITKEALVCCWLLRINFKTGYFFYLAWKST